MEKDRSHDQSNMDSGHDDHSQSALFSDQFEILQQQISGLIRTQIKKVQSEIIQNVRDEFINVTRRDDNTPDNQHTQRLKSIVVRNPDRVRFDSSAIKSAKRHTTTTD